METVRIFIRLSPAIKARAEKASAILGVRSLTEYIVKLIDENSAKVIEQHESISLENDMFDEFMRACQHVQPPNEELAEVAAFTTKFMSKG